MGGLDTNGVHAESARATTARVLALCVAWAVPSCSKDSACVDEDGDGFGMFCSSGSDCDDQDPALNQNCLDAGNVDCAVTPFSAGCPCLPGAQRECYDGPPATEGVGLCVAGSTLCIDGVWQACNGAVTPTPEFCDGRDQDCDGQTDEGAGSPCGGCTPGCDGAVWGDRVRPFTPTNGAALIGEALTLARTPPPAESVWVANTAEDTVSKIDPATALESARYPSGGAEPSRVAVDYLGNAWIANRDLTGQSTVRQIGGVVAQCVDRNASETIDTSTGPGDIRDDDECVRQTMPIGVLGGAARALAIDGDPGGDGSSGGDLWVGLHNQEVVIELDGQTGEERSRVDTPGFQPYTAAFDPWGMLWVISRDGQLARIDRRATPPSVDIDVIPFACFLLYGLAIDETGTLLVTGFSCDQVMTYHPRADRWERLETLPSARGAAISGTEAWVAHTDGRLSRLSLNPLAVQGTVDLFTEGFSPLESIGVGVDTLGSVWVASSQGAPDGLGVATQIRETGEQVIGHLPLGAGPHTQGDLTGAKRLGGFAPEGFSREVFTGCPEDETTRWESIHVDFDPGARGLVTISIRHAANSDALTETDFDPLGVLPTDDAPFPLDVPENGALEVELKLETSARDGAPRIFRVGVEWACIGSFG